MITTVIVWPQPEFGLHLLNNENPTELQRKAMKEMSDTIAPGFVPDISIYFNPANMLRTAVRSWPDVETALAWVNYITTNYTVNSAEVFQTQVNTDEYGILVMAYE
jgi:hypothetical protein